MDNSKLEKYSIILASSSPRRQQFLTNMNIPFTIEVKEVEEIYPKNLQAHEITNYLAELKANAFTNLAPNQIVITSDTIVWHNNKALGKPVNYNDAFSMLSNLSNSTHQVYTSVCIKTATKTNTFYDCTSVTFSKLTEQDIHYYLENYKPFDKAGSYGIQDWIGLIGIQSINGSYSNVVGLPTEKLYFYLQNNF